MKRLLILLVSCAALAQETDPITDKMRFDLALAQRDYLLSQQTADKAADKVREKIAEVNKACGNAGKQFDPASFTCVDKK